MIDRRSHAPQGETLSLAADSVVVPESHQRAAEEVRAHLVVVRGGAPFLSPGDARLLVRWLDEGLSISLILRAIERAADARRKKRSRVPLSLTRAKRHLDAVREAGSAVAETKAEQSLASVAKTLVERGAAPLAAELLRIPKGDPDEGLRLALARVRDFLSQRWNALPASDRAVRLQCAREELVLLELGFDENGLVVAAEELARDELRAEWPMLEARELWAAVRTRGPA